MTKTARESRRALRHKGFNSRKVIGVIICVVLISAAISFFIFFSFGKNVSSAFNIRHLAEQWKNNEIEAVYEESGKLMDENLFQKNMLIFRGYSAFKIAVSSLDSGNDTLTYLDEAINLLRVAVLLYEKDIPPQLYYILGQAYFYKNKFSSYYYYSDLAIRYLEQAVAKGYKADDISELLGLSYAEIGNTEKSIQLFSEALRIHETDALLYNIAKEYYQCNQASVAKQYLQRTIQTSQNDDIILSSRFILGKIYLEEEKYSEAQGEFETILEKNENFADAHYQLGVLYEKLGDKAKARAEWRKCLRVQVNHPGALQKLSEVK